MTTGESSQLNFKEVYASSTLPASSVSAYGCENLTDGLVGTTWSENVNGLGEGEWVQLLTEEPNIVEYIRIASGYWSSEKNYIANASPRLVNIETYKKGYLMEEKQFELKRLEYKEHGNYFQDVYLESYAEVDEIRITIISAYPGTKYEDTCISEIEVYGKSAWF